jgi:hypothetical protein
MSLPADANRASFGPFREEKRPFFILTVLKKIHFRVFF